MAFKSPLIIYSNQRRCHGEHFRKSMQMYIPILIYNGSVLLSPELLLRIMDEVKGVLVRKAGDMKLFATLLPGKARKQIFSAVDAMFILRTLWCTRCNCAILTALRSICALMNAVIDKDWDSTRFARTLNTALMPSALITCRRFANTHNNSMMGVARRPNLACHRGQSN